MKISDIGDCINLALELQGDKIIAFNICSNNESFQEGASIDGILTDSVYLASEDLQGGNLDSRK